MAKAAEDGHRVILVTATGGEQGEVADGFLNEGETLGERRALELAEAAKVLGAEKQLMLGYYDSGMMGTPENDNPECFWQADTEEAAQKLAKVLEAEGADVLTIYDENGVYGHPDHIKVWQVGVRAAEIAGTKKVYEGTVNRTAWQRRINAGSAPLRTIESVDGVDTLVDHDEAPATIEFPMGVPEEQLTTAVDVKKYVDRKKQAMRVHASQITEESFFLKMPDEVFAEGFGTEWFILRGAPAGVHEYDLFDGI